MRSSTGAEASEVSAHGIEASTHEDEALAVGEAEERGVAEAMDERVEEPTRAEVVEDATPEAVQAEETEPKEVALEPKEAALEAESEEGESEEAAPTPEAQVAASSDEDAARAAAEKPVTPSSLHNRLKMLQQQFAARPRSPDVAVADKPAPAPMPRNAFNAPTRPLDTMELSEGLLSGLDGKPPIQRPQAFAVRVSRPEQQRATRRVPELTKLTAPKPDETIHGFSRTPFKEPLGNTSCEQLNALWVEYIKANHTCGRDLARLKPKAFYKHLAQNHKAICARYNCDNVRFTVKIKNNKVCLQAAPIHRAPANRASV